LGIELFRVGGAPKRFTRIGKLIVGAQGNAHSGSRLP
jgi:hypothetical protein